MKIKKKVTPTLRNLLAQATENWKRIRNAMDEEVKRDVVEDDPHKDKEFSEHARIIDFIEHFMDNIGTHKNRRESLILLMALLAEGRHLEKFVHGSKMRPIPTYQQGWEDARRKILNKLERLCESSNPVYRKLHTLILVDSEFSTCQNETESV